jgi:hypothetical protein
VKFVDERVDCRFILGLGGRRVMRGGHFEAKKRREVGYRIMGIDFWVNN